MSTAPPDGATAGHAPRPSSHRLGLRARITLAFALGAALLSILLAGSTLTVFRNSLLQARERQVVQRTSQNSAAVDRRWPEATEGAEQVLSDSLSSLQAADAPVLVVDGGRTELSGDTTLGAEALPASLREEVVVGGQASVMRFQVAGDPYLAVGIPLRQGEGAGYFEMSSLQETEDNILALFFTLLVGGLVTTAAGAAVGWWASRRTLRPLSGISDAAIAVADGHLETRLPDPHDPDLSPLVSSFNSMVQTLQDRIDRDARFASDVSHELRSPLMTLQASVHVLENNRDDLPERACTALELLGSEVERFAQLVEDLLEISRFDAGAVRLELDDVALVDTVTATVEHTLDRPITVRFEPALIGLVIRCDKRRLNRILANFLDNAEKYADGAVLVSIERERDLIRVAVEDEGPGVPEVERDLIFDRFSRGSQGGSRGTDRGVGLGLALASEHARLQGGRVWVEGRHSGQSGARFVVELPALGDADDQFGDESVPEYA